MRYEIGIGLENRLTIGTAFALLHFLYHAATLVFKTCHVSLPFGPDEWVMDPAVSAMLRKPRFHIWAGRVEYNGTEESSLAAMKTISSLVGSHEVALERGVEGILLLRDPEFVASGKRLRLEAHVQHRGFADHVDRLVNVR